VRAAAPEVLLVARLGADAAPTLGEVSELAALPGWWGLPAVKAGRVFVVDAALFLRPGPRLVRFCFLLSNSDSY
jgi:iron complex transport system substrate-binding protein